MKFFRPYVLPVTVFLTGGCVLIVEVVATRILSPYYGSTIFTVSSVISVILAALSVGYYVGGQLADKHPSLHWFFRIILLSGLTLLFFHGIGLKTLPAFGYDFSASAGPLFFSLLLFFLPAFLLGMLSPYALKLQNSFVSEQGIGTIAGKIFFWSTLGSILGSLLAGFVLIPHFGVNEIIVANGIFLFLFGMVSIAVLNKTKSSIVALIVSVLLAVFFLYVFSPPEKDVLYSKDGIYEKITVYDDNYKGRPVRVFQQDRSQSGAMFLDSDDPRDLVHEYTKYYSLYRVFTPEVKNALVIGGGVYSIPKALLADLPDVTVDVSEIEPSLLDLSKKYFGVKDDPRLHTFNDDGRRFLYDSEKKYDLIFSDVYHSLFSIPMHFTTKEFFNLAKERVNEDGIFIANILGDLSRQQPSFVMSEIKTFQTAFPNSYFFLVKTDSQVKNIIFVGYKSEKKIDLNAPAIVSDHDVIIRSLHSSVIDMGRFDLSPHPILTDNFAPVEYLTGNFMQRTTNQDNFFDGDEMLALIEQQLQYGPRYPTGAGHEKTKEFLVAEMKALRLDVNTQKWQHSEENGKSYHLVNVIARLNPEKVKRIIIGTHYDSQKMAFNDPSDPSNPSPGANNSASGVSVLLYIAQLLSLTQSLPDIGIDFVFFDGEEGEESQGADFTRWRPLGSTYFSQNLSGIYGDEKPVAGIILDMVCDKNLKILREETSVENAPAQTESFWNIAQNARGNVFKREVYQGIGNDHTPLNDVGIPSFLVIDFDYPHYATAQDTVDKCSADSLEAVTEALWDYLHTDYAKM